MGPRSGPLDVGTRRGRKRTAAPGEARRAATAQVTAARSRRQACARPRRPRPAASTWQRWAVSPAARMRGWRGHAGRVCPSAKPHGLQQVLDVLNSPPAPKNKFEGERGYCRSLGGRVVSQTWSDSALGPRRPPQAAERPPGPVGLREH